MGKRLFFVWVGILLILGAGATEKRNAVVWKVDIKSEIGPQIWRLVRKSFDESEKQKADYVLIHMNTYGGMVVYADSLRSLILNHPKPVWVFIDNNAASAGALISIACDKIYMREGANIGAAAVVNQSGEAMPDKYQSYMRSMIRATAQAHGKDRMVSGQDTIWRWKRDPHIAEAMVDQNIRIAGISDSGKIVTFTPHEAIQYGFCDGIAENVEEILALEKVDDYTIKEYKPDTIDRIIGFLIHPVLRGILIMVIVGGIYFELQTPGVGFPLIAAVTACLLYFAPLYLEGIASHWEIIAFIFGLILLLLEIFVIPGFGIAGVAGIILIILSLVFAGIDQISFEFPGDFVLVIIQSLFLVVSSSVIALGGSMWLGAKLMGSRRFAFALHAEQKVTDGYVGVDMGIQQVVGKSGHALTDLRPSGKVLIEGEVYDAVSLLGGYITKNTKVTVRKYQAGQIYVEKDVSKD